MQCYISCTPVSLWPESVYPQQHFLSKKTDIAWRLVTNSKTLDIGNLICILFPRISLWSVLMNWGKKKEGDFTFMSIKYDYSDFAFQQPNFSFGKRFFVKMTNTFKLINTFKN